MSTKMGFCVFRDEGFGSALQLVASKSDYTQKEFQEACDSEAAECEYTLGEVKEAHCRWFVEEGFYSFCQAGKGAFPVWYCDINP